MIPSILKKPTILINTSNCTSSINKNFPEYNWYKVENAFEIKLSKLLKLCNFANSISEASRLIKEGAIELGTHPQTMKQAKEDILINKHLLDSYILIKRKKIFKMEHILFVNNYCSNLTNVVLI